MPGGRNEHERALAEPHPRVRSGDIHVRQAPIRPSSSDMWFISYLPLALSDGLSSPLIPLFALAVYSNSALVVAGVIAASSVSEVPFTILWGNLSDRVHHRKFFLVASFLGTGVCLIAMPFSRTFGEYVAINVLAGLATAASAPIGTMLLLETRAKRWWPRDIGLFGLISGVGTVLGLSIGAVWLIIIAPGGGVTQTLDDSLQGLLILSGALAIVSGVIAWRYIEEPGSRLERKSVAELLQLQRGVVERLRGYRRRVLDIVDLARGAEEPVPRAEWVFLAALFVMSIGFQIFYGPFVFFLSSSSGGGLAQADIFLIFLASAAASTALFYHSGLAVERASPKWVFIGSLAARVAIIPAFLLAVAHYPDDPRALTILFVLLNGLMGVTWAFLSTASTVFLVRLVGITNKGKALGLYNALAGFGGLSGTLFGGWLYVTSGSATTTYLVAALVVGLGAIMLLPLAYRRTPYLSGVSEPIRSRAPRTES